MATLALVPIYLPDRMSLVRRLTGALSDTLRLDIQIRKPWFDPEGAFDPSRGQYHSTRLLGMLLDSPGLDVDRVLGVTSVDLFIPVLTYVFGEAQLDGTAAVVSIDRLRPEAYGLPRDDDLLFDRLLKEAVHELGHTIGLIHCPSPRCVMRSSTYVEDIDLKPATFCRDCSDPRWTVRP